MKWKHSKSLVTGALSAALVIGSLTVAGSSALAQTRVNVGHLAPFDADIANTAVSVEVGGSEVLTGVVFNQFSGYLELSGAGVAPGMTLVEVFAPPATPPAAISDTFDLPADTDFTVAAIGGPNSQPLEYLVLVDDQTAPAAGNVRIRIVHAAPFADTPVGTEVSVRLQDGTLVDPGLTNVQYTQDSGFLELPAGTYDLKISTPDGSTTLIDPLPVDLPDGVIVTVFAVGDGVNQPLGITAVFGDGSFAPLAIEPGTRVNAAHLAPFAPVLADTAVSIDVNGGEVLTGVEFNQSSGYLNIAGPETVPGMTQVEVFAPPGAMTAAIDDTFDLPADTDFTVAAIGDGVNQPLALLPLVDETAPPAAGNGKIRIVHVAPFAAALPDTAVSVRLDEGGVVNNLNSVQYTQDSGFFELPAGIYDLVIATPDGSTNLINPGPVTLADGDIVTFYAVGDGVNQPLGITAIDDEGNASALALEFEFIPVPTLSMIGLFLMMALLAFVAIRRLT